MEAATTLSHCVAVACPGSGKTKMLASKAAYLLSLGYKVCTVTFTKESAMEIRERILQIVGKDAASRLTSGTFHGLCYKQTGLKSLNNIATEGDRVAYVLRAIEISGVDCDVDMATALIEQGKASSLLDANSDIGRLVNAYQDILQRNKKIDFQDIIVNAVRGLKDGSLKPFDVDHLLVDEFQDTDELQFDWLSLHAKAGIVITAVGDDDQSIYAFRHALGYQGMERFVDAYNANRVVLAINYRCHDEILSSAGRVIANNRGRIPKSLVAHRGLGGSVQFKTFPSPILEGVAVAERFADTASSGRSSAVLARTNRRLDFVESALVARGIPFVRTGGGSLFDRPEPSLFADLVDLACGQKTTGLDHALAWAGMSEEDLRRLIDHYGHKPILSSKEDMGNLNVSDKSMDIWREFVKRWQGWSKIAQDGKDALLLSGIASWMRERTTEKGPLANIDLAEMVFMKFDTPIEKRTDELKKRRKKKDKPDAGVVVLTTMHGSKGLEWDRVWIVAAEETVVPDEKSPIEEERRLFYVGMTRARDDLTISASTKNRVSRFVDEFLLTQGVQPC